jgi:hypothetical protein
MLHEADEAPQTERLDLMKTSRPRPTWAHRKRDRAYTRTIISLDRGDRERLAGMTESFRADHGFRVSVSIIVALALEALEAERKRGRKRTSRDLYVTG